jgi:hypothetical protein
MLRLPPSSISLSEEDIKFHLRQAQLIRNLREDGYNKPDIERYAKDYLELTTQRACQNAPGLELPAPTADELIASRNLPHCPQDATVEDEPQQAEGHMAGGLPTDATDTVTAFPDLPLDLVKERRHRKQSKNCNVEPSSVAVRPAQHAPRKSSLLRFAQAASPEGSPDDGDGGFEMVSDVRPPKLRLYNGRSNSYTYQSSECESVASALEDQVVFDGMSRLSLGDGNLDDELDNSSFALPPAYSPAVRTLPASDLQFASPVSGHGSDDSLSVHFDRSVRARRQGSGDHGGPAYTSTDLPSSPPLPVAPATHGSRASRAGESPQLPSTPTPIRALFPHTEGRFFRHQLDGNSFSVYNDSLPASDQPQTPADLSRRPIINEQNAAYTEPPGMIMRSAPGRRLWEPEYGEQSPTTRAVTLRERRARELARSARAEGARLGRMRIRDEAMLHAGARHATEAAHTFGQTGEDAWREELILDRVGEENFEVDLEPRGRRIMRAVSGNARFEQ